MSNAYQTVTDRIIAMLEAGTPPWRQTWTAPGGGRPLRANGLPYRGANTLNLWAAAQVRGFQSPFWITYKGAQAIGAQVKKGARAEAAFYVGSTTKTETDANGDEAERRIAFLKSYAVFNAAEVDGLPAHMYPAAPAPRVGRERFADADAWISSTGANIHHGGGRAYYRPSTDEIQMPAFDAFDDAPAYYDTVLHELAHWTGAKHRLDRAQKGMFGNPDYAFEELVAELSAAFLCADLKISAEPRQDHAAYIKSWLKALKDDARAIFRAAAHAERAATYLHELQQPGAARPSAPIAAPTAIAA